MAAIRTTYLPEEPSYVSPGGVTEIRLLLQFPAGEIAHATVPPNAVSSQSWVLPTSEWFFVLSGSGQLWDASAAVEIALVPGRAYYIPPGCPIQYRAGDDSLKFLVITVPQSRPSHHHIDSAQHWQPTAAAVEGEESWHIDERSVDIHDAAPERCHTAPDGSLNLLIGDEPDGGLALCAIAPGATTIPVMHPSVEQLWYVLEGSGQVSRRQGSLDPEVTTLTPGACVDIGRGITFQFRADEGRSSGEAARLKMLLLTVPRWPGPNEGIFVPGAATWDFTVSAS